MRPIKLNNWDFSEQEIEKAVKENRLLLLDAETSNMCNLRCPYCYRDIYGDKQKLKGELSLEERKDLLNHAKELGCRTVKLPGAGEPIIDPLFWEQVEYANKIGMDIIVFTNGLALTNKTAKRLKKLGASLILKFNSQNSEVEDKLVNMKGYSKRRKKALEILVKNGFNKGNPTSLGIDAVITKMNKNEVLDLFRYCRQNNIFPIIKPFMPLGGALRVKEWEVERDEVVELFRKSMNIDRKEFRIDYEFSLTYMGSPCDQRRYAIFVDILGNAFICTGSSKLLGNIRETKLKDIWNRKDLKEMRKLKYNKCFPREEYWSKQKRN